MQLDVTTFDRRDLRARSSSRTRFFGLEPRTDLIARCHPLAAAKRRAGTHAVKGTAPRSPRTGKKLYKQKGTGNARHGSARVPQFRTGGGRAFGPQVREPRARPAQEGAPRSRSSMRSRRKLAKDQSLIVVDDARHGRTEDGELAEGAGLGKLAVSTSAMSIIVGASRTFIEPNFAVSAATSTTSAHDMLVVTKAGLEGLKSSDIIGATSRRREAALRRAGGSPPSHEAPCRASACTT